MENNMMLIGIAVVVLIIFLCTTKQEGFAGKCSNNKPKYVFDGEFNPRAFNPAISEQAMDDGIIPLPNRADYPWAKNTGNYGEADILDDGANGNLGMGYNMCSKACCSQSWPTPHMSVTPDDFLLLAAEEGKEFVPTNMTCNNGWQDSGCLCATKEQILHSHI